MVWEKALPMKSKGRIRSSFIACPSDEIRRLNAPHAGGLHCRPGLGERALVVDAAARVLDDQRFKALPARVERAPRDAEVGGEPREENPLQRALLQISAEAGLSF